MGAVPVPLHICCATVRGHGVIPAWHQRATQRALSVNVEAPKIHSPLRPLFFRIAEQKASGGEESELPFIRAERPTKRSSLSSPLPVARSPPNEGRQRLVYGSRTARSRSNIWWSRAYAR
ncbi:Piso0_000691 [Millerozyma farinosa CBS 7064]|uniref:Piso0_000691 protein n=1 Tax=Pichia sorbitophila (strain ATCC MYA-4447 / BCRC 22081 / CBS 7064 / NBRC 10061 / NRRL Y-12695) TaxID=559304 RepID=G8YPT0_PICSO|nr:Piso0_000691 [Millerozyma farinosa CBS 7064]